MEGISTDKNVNELKLWPYAEDAYWYNLLKIDRDRRVQWLYDDISPTMTHVNYETREVYTVSYRPETFALEIIELKEEYDRLLKEHEQKARLFNEGMKILSEQEQAVIEYYFMRQKKDIDLSNSKFHEILKEAQMKLLSFIESGLGQ